MTIRNMKKLALAANAVTFADPSSIRNTLRVKNGITEKKVGTIAATNIRTEFIANEQAVLTQGTATGSEPLSIRVVISGSQANATELQRMWENMKSNVDTSVVAGTLNGFLPAEATLVIGA